MLKPKRGLIGWVKGWIRPAADLEPKSPPPNIVIPIYLPITNWAVRHWGSGVLIKHRDCHWLVTAAHVSDGETGNEGTLITCGAGPMLRLPDPVVETKPPPGQPRANDLLDQAVIPLSPETAGRLEAIGFSFAPASSVVEREVMRLERLVLLGFPGNLQECKNEATGTWFATRPTVVLTKLVPLDEAAAMGYSPDSHLVARYNASNRQPLHTQTASTPMPPGMSGGAVLLVEEDGFGLAGIITRWNDPGYVIATKAPFWLTMLDTHLDQCESGKQPDEAG